MAILDVKSPAKLNLFLHIVGQRDDGYHLLQSIMRPISLYDDLNFAVRKDKKITINGMNIANEDNLIFKAAKLLQQKHGVTITIKKNIPMGAGLGGGSSNAATTLLTLNKLWQRGLSKTTLCELGLGLGADVPFFINGKAAIVEGIGENITDITLPEAWYVLIVPNCHVSTKKIFTHPDLTRDTIPRKITASEVESGHNDCEAIVRKLYPEINAAIEWLAQYAQPRLTGTGCGVFASFSDKADADVVFAKAKNLTSCHVSLVSST